jgi:hypothetical protein
MPNKWLCFSPFPLLHDTEARENFRRFVSSTPLCSFLSTPLGYYDAFSVQPIRPGSKGSMQSGFLPKFIFTTPPRRETCESASFSNIYKKNKKNPAIVHLFQGKSVYLAYMPGKGLHICRFFLERRR